ncbi:uncharacterized protein LOC106660244 [Trichogramma pretiosum]|uniref:uncharacterized protein LOC106660244 n=1 Tax=Trichogramma pretiosum TaxID=7493 RepID=UPI0006C99CB0|nr:uncharacterized protein LOC106660244 [Trichogramma pretiosum]
MQSMWKYVARGVRDTIERRTCRTNIYSQSAQQEPTPENPERSVDRCKILKSVRPQFFAVFNRYGYKKYSGAEKDETKDKYKAEYTWCDAVSWSSVLAVGYVVCHTLCLRLKRLEIDNFNIEQWRRRLLENQSFGTSQAFYKFFLPKPQFILSISKHPAELEDSVKTFEDQAIKDETFYGPPTADEAIKEALDKFILTHKKVLAEHELDYGMKAIEEKRFKDAVQHFTIGSELLSVSSMFNLGLCYELGLGTSVDYSKAAEYYQKAADKNHIDAMYNLGIFYAQGKGDFQVNLSTAKKLFTQAAKNGHIKASKALLLEKAFQKQSGQKYKNSYLEVKTLKNNVNNNVISTLLNFNFLNDIDMSIKKSDEIDNLYNDEKSSKNPTEVFLEILGVNEETAMQIIYQ